MLTERTRPNVLDRHAPEEREKAEREAPPARQRKLDIAPLTMDDIDVRIGQWVEQEREISREVMAHVIVDLQDEIDMLAKRPAPKGERGERGPPGTLPLVKVWHPDTVAYSGEVVAYDGSTFQAIRDTARAPGMGDDWTLVARGGTDGRTPQIRGTFNAREDYHHLDVVACNGSSFVAKRDDPGPCPGDGWQLISSAGRTGKAGEKGEPGSRGIIGPPGPKGDAAAAIVGWTLDHENFAAVPLMSDGRRGPALELKGFFEAFLQQVSHGRR
jgi:hypothetical protein